MCSVSMGSINEEHYEPLTQEEFNYYSQKGLALMRKCEELKQTIQKW